jgi:murein DD-endopeptidase MepM/ murein hydrolase activator NlpD
MSMLGQRLLFFIPIIGLCLAGTTLAQPVGIPSPLTVSLSPGGRAVRPGVVVRVEVRSRKPLAKIEGTLRERPIAFILAADGKEARALIGLAADTATGDHAIAIHGETTGGEPVEAERTLTVTPAQFRSQKLRVDPRFVQPPKDELPRIEQERARLADLSHAIDRDRPWHAPFEPPLDSPVTEPYGVKRTFNGELASQHRGVDLKGAMGTPIAAPGAGRVVLAEELYYTGNTVVIDHGYGVLSLLAHMSHIGVKVGDLVDAGATVGEVGATGRVTGPHLHWSAWVGGVSIDPLSLIAAIGR